MKIVCISDTHNKHADIIIPNGDIIVHTGDFTNTGSYDEVKSFIDWFTRLDFEYKILVAGNHETTLDVSFYEEYWESFHKNKQDTAKIKDIILDSNIIYLEDSSVTIQNINFYGSPYTLAGEVLWGFQLHSDGESDAKWASIPDNTDILLTHSPPEGYLDTYKNHHYGCDVLLLHVKDRVKPVYHIFGHVHCQNGMVTEHETTFVNVGIVDGNHVATYSPVVINIK